MKTPNPVVSALAAWLLIVATVMLSPSRIGAQPSGAADNNKEADRAKRLEEARQEVTKAKAEAAELRLRLEKERQRAEQAEREALAQRDAARQAEAEARRRAEQALAAEQAARHEADKARYAAELRAAQEAFAKGKEQAGNVTAKQLLQELEREKAALLARYQAQRVELMTQLKRLDEEQQRVLEDLAQKAASLRSKVEPAAAPARPDRLDQILERLERIEGRLDRLERRGKLGGGQGKN